MIKNISIADYCICGGGAEIELIEATPSIARQFSDAFWRVHSGPGHKATTRSIAASVKNLQPNGTNVIERATITR